MENEKRNVAIILTIILLAQVGLRIYVGSRKEYFHMDEAYSYGNMNYNKPNISDNKDFLNTWHTKQYYLDYFEINKDEIFNLKPIYENQKNDVHPPFYYLLLRIFASFTIDNFSKWTGIILNIIIFIFSFIFVYLISKELFKSKIYALLVCVINGFTIISLESCLYIRMYELCNLNILIITYLHMKIYYKSNLKIKDMSLILISLILGGMTHYYFFIYVLALYVIYNLKCINNKNNKNLLVYNITIFVSAFIYLLMWRYSISHIFFGYRGIENCVDVFQFLERLVKYIKILDNGLWNNLLIKVFIFVIAVSITRGKKRRVINIKIILLLIPIIIYLVVVMKNSPYVEQRYVMPIYSVCTILVIYIAKVILKMFWDNNSTFLLTTLMFLIIIYSPKISNKKLEYTYEKYNNIASKIEEYNLNIVYIFNTQNNRFLDDVYLFTIPEKSIVLEYNSFKIEELINILCKNNNGIILIMNEGIDEDYIKENMKDYEFEYIQRMNACNIYRIMV